MKKLLLPFLCLSLFLVSCDKDKNETPPKTKTELLTQASWKFSVAMMGATDVSGSIPACRKDNTLKFETNGTGLADEGATKCNGADPQTYALTWNFLSAETQIKILPILFSGGSDTYTVVSISETQLVMSQNMTLPAPFGVQNVSVTFIH